MNQTKFVIFLPVRNGGHYVKQAVDSVLAQDREDWQLVILENASTDGTPEVLSQYHDERIRVVPSSKPLSIWENWNRGYELLLSKEVAGEYITFLGHDDYFYQGFLDAINNMVEDDPSATLYQTLFDLIDSYDAPIRPCRPIPSRETYFDYVMARCWGLRDSFGTGYVFRAQDYVKVGGIPNYPQLLCSDDMLFTRLSALGHKACNRQAECAYRMHRGSASAELTSAKLNAHVEATARYIDDLVKDCEAIAGSRAGREGVACYLSREIAVYGSRNLLWTLSPANRVRVKQLMQLFAEYGHGLDVEPWLNANVRAGSVYMRARRIALALAILRRKLLFK